MPGSINYFIGDDPQSWRTNVPHYSRVQYRGVYSGIDLVYYARDGQVEYDFVVAPTVDAETIVFGIEGGDHVEIDENGDVVITVLGETFRMKKPVVFQEIRGVQEIVAANYFRKDENEFGFLIDRYDSTLPLIIDPVLTYATYLGGSNADTVQEMAVDDAGNAYLTGRTDSLDFPTSPTPFQASFAGGTLDTFVTKLAADGSLVYSTYLGGSSQDFGVAVAVDASGHVYVLGDTDSTDFPTASPFQSAVAGLRDAFVTKLSPDGSTLIYSTYLGGSSSEAPQSIALDNSGNTYLAMFSLSTDYPTTVGTFDTDCGTATNCNFGAGDAVVTKLNPSGSGLVYSTFLGGSKGDNARNIAVNSAGEAYVIGATSSDTDFPLANAAQNSFAGTVDAFVTKLSANGSALLYSTYLGGSGTEDLQGGVIDIAVDSSDHAYVTGNTDSTDFPVLNALQPGSGGAIDSFIAKFDPSGVVQFSTYLGGLGSENATNITVDGSSNIYVSGQVRSDNFPITPDAIQSLRAGSFDVFVTKLSGDGSTILFSTYLGGTAFDAPQGIGLDSVRNVYISGITLSTDFPTSAAFQPSFAGGANDGFVARITLAARGRSA